MSLAEPAFSIEGSTSIGANNRNGNSSQALNLSYTIRAEELSVVDYQYGASTKVTFNNTASNNNPTLESYEFYFSRSSYRLTISDALEPDQTPETRLAYGEGLFEAWQAIQPLDGGAAFQGVFSDNAEEGTAALMLGTQWGDTSLNVALGRGGVGEVGMALETGFGGFTVAASSGSGSLPSSVALGMNLEFGNSLLLLSASQASDTSQQTYGFSLANEFDLATLTFSGGADTDGLVTGYTTSGGVLFDFFVGARGLMSFGIGSRRAVSGHVDRRTHLNYSSERDFGEVVVGLGDYNGEAIGEFGVKFSL